jgi:phosphate transport system protein
MGTLGVEMWRLCADAWVSRNPLAVDHLEERDDELDELHATLCAEVVIGAHSLPVAMDMALVARFFERLGDHAVNISRRIVYLAGADAVGAGVGAAEGDAVGGVIVPGVGLG